MTTSFNNDCVTLEQMNKHEWARSDKWNVRFRSGQGPSEFGNWLPATELTTPLFNIQSFDWSSGHRTLSLPKSIDYPDISMTLLDDDKRSIKKFLQDWFIVAFPEDGGIQYLSEMVKVLQVAALDLQNNPVTKEEYIVYPVGSVNNPFTNDPSIVSYPLTFKVCGYKRNAS